MSSSLTAKVTLGSAERPGHLPTMYRVCIVWQSHLRADGLTPETCTSKSSMGGHLPN